MLLGATDEIVILASVSATHTANIDVLKSIVDNDAGNGDVYATTSNKLIMNNNKTIPINNLLTTNATISNLVSENLLTYTSDSIDLISSSGNILNLFTTTHSSGTIDTNRINANTTNSTFINSQDILTVGLIGTNSAFTNVSANNLSSPIITEINGSVSSLLSQITEINNTTSNIFSQITQINNTTNSLISTTSSLLSSISLIDTSITNLNNTTSNIFSSISGINATTNSLLSSTSSLLSSISLIDTSIANLSFTTSNSFSNLLVSGTSNLSFNSNTIGSIFTTGGNVGIGTINPYGKLDLGTDIVNRKLLLYSGNNDHQYLGFGVNNNILRYQVGALADSHVFYAAINSTSSLELMRIKGDGNVSILGDLKPRTVNWIGKTFEAESSFGNVYFSSDIDANNRSGNITYTSNYPFPFFTILKKGIWAITVNLQLNPNTANRTVFMTKNSAYNLAFGSINQNDFLAWTSVNDGDNWETQLNFTGILNVNDQIRIRVSGGLLQASGNLHFTKICDL